MQYADWPSFVRPKMAVISRCMVTEVDQKTIMTFGEAALAWG